MSDWSIQIAYRDPDDLILDAITASREKLDETDAQVAEAVIRDAFHNRSITTVAGLLDELGGLDQAGARARLDWARGELGLPSTGEVEQRRSDFHFEAAFQRLEPPPPPKWSPMQVCAVCGTYPMGPSGWERVSVERWHCPAHEHLAKPGDMEEHEFPYTGRFTPGGAPIPSPKEKARLEAWYQERQAKEKRERQRRDDYRRREADVIQAAKQRFADEGEINIMGVRCRPDGRIIG